MEASGNPSIGQALERNDHLPFASAVALALENEPADEFAHLHSAHRDHLAVIAAIRLGDAPAAERGMAEHAQAALGSERLFQRFR